MKWVSALVLVILAALAAGDVAWADRGRGVQQLQARHDGFQPRHFQPRRDGLHARHVQPRRADGFQTRGFQSRRDGSRRPDFRARSGFRAHQPGTHRDIRHSRHFTPRTDIAVIGHRGIRTPGHDRFAGHRVHRRAGSRIIITAPLIWHWPGPYPAYPAYRPYPPVVTVPAMPPVYIERPDPDPGYGAPGDPRFWYYCRDPAGYYPYVGACPGGWQRVDPTPPDLGGR